MARTRPARRALVPFAAALLVVGLAAPQAWAWYHLRAAQAALAGYHPHEARKSLASCERVWGGRESVRLLASRAARQDGDLDAAMAELRAAQRLAGGATEDTAFEWALLQAAAGNVREVDEYLQKRADAFPGAGPLVWEALAEGYLRVSRIDVAMACVNLWLSRDKQNVRALELRGQAFVAGRGVVRGADDYRKVLELDPTRRETRRRLTECLLSLGAYDEAAGHLEAFARENPGDPEITARLARCYNMLGRGPEARKMVDDALARHPDNGMCLRTRGQFAVTDQQNAEAERLLRHAAGVMPEDYQTQFLLFQALRAQEKVEEARAQLARAEAVKERAERIGELRSRRLAEQPLDPGVQYEMGTLYTQTGRPDAAEQYFLNALNLDPGHKPSHAALADYYERRGDKDKAEEHRRAAAP